MKLLGQPLRLLLALMFWACASAGAQTLPLLSIESFSWTEHDQGETRMPVTLRLSAPNNDRDVTGFFTATQNATPGVSPLHLATPGPACADGVDFVQQTNTPFTIRRGETSTVIEVVICGDRVLEDDELFVLTVNAGTLAGARCPNTSGGCIGVPSIVNDDTTGTVVRIDDVRIQEPASGTVDAVLTLRLSRRIAEDAVISFRTQSDSAVSGVAGAYFLNGGCVGRHLLTGATVHRDFLAASGTRTIAAGSLTAEIRVPICADGNALKELQKRFYVLLTATAGGLVGIADGRGQVDILANGPALLGSAQLSLGEAGAQADTPQLYKLHWTVPQDRLWHDLRTIALRIAGGQRPALWLRWNQLDNTFMLCRQAGRGDEMDDMAARISGIPDHGCSLGALPGSKTVLETRDLRLHLAGTRAVGSGPAGRSVTLELALSFKSPTAAPREIEVSAADAFGSTQPYARMATLQVLGKGSRP